MLNFNRVLIHSLYICICAKIRCHTKHHNTPSKIWLQHLSQNGHYIYCFSFRLETLFCLIWVTDVRCLYFIIPENWAPHGKRITNWRFKFGFKNLNFILSPFLWWLITDFYKKFTIFDEMAKVHKLNILKRKKCIRSKHTEIEMK